VPAILCTVYCVCVVVCVCVHVCVLSVCSNSVILPGQKDLHLQGHCSLHDAVCNSCFSFLSLFCRAISKDGAVARSMSCLDETEPASYTLHLNHTDTQHNAGGITAILHSTLTILVAGALVYPQSHSLTVKLVLSSWCLCAHYPASCLQYPA